MPKIDNEVLALTTEIVKASVASSTGAWTNSADAIAKLFETVARKIAQLRDER